MVREALDGRILLTKDALKRELQACGIKEGHTICVHCSLRAFGFVVGGAETVVRVLLELVGDEGTLLMPTQTWKNLDPSTGVHWQEPKEWWPVLREHWPPYDPDVTPSLSMGAVAEMLRTWPGTKRSQHPARSVAAYGKYADYLTENHELSNIFGEGSPFSKLYDVNGYVLLLGVGYDKVTSLHLAETRATFPSKRWVTESSAILIDGRREWVSYETQQVVDDDFVTLGREYESEHTIPIYKVGNAEVRYVRQPHLVDWATRWMEANRS